MRSMWLLISLVILALIAGCGGGDVGEDTGASASGATTAESSGDSGGGAESIDIEPFAIPLPPGVVREISRTETGVSLFYPADDYDAVVAFFEDWTTSEADTYERFDRTDPAISVSWEWRDGASGQNRVIVVVKDFDGGNNFGAITSVQVSDLTIP